MHISWQYRLDRDNVLVFCNGWGMDHNPFTPLGSREYDVVLLHDFSSLAKIDDLLPTVERYRQRVLVGWSMGVWGGQMLFPAEDQLFHRTIAVNGTLRPIDDRYGIPKDLFAGTMEGWSELTRRKFYHRLCGASEIERAFLACQPCRSLADQQRELACYLESCAGIPREHSIYSEIVVSEKDRIVPTLNQRAFWGDEVFSLAGGHFPFYQWEYWDDFLQSISNVQK